MKFPAFEPIDIRGNIHKLEVVELEIAKVIPNPNQPRKNFCSLKLSELADSIKSEGVLQPILVKAVNNGFFQIIAGERRWRASKIAGKNTIPSIIKKEDGDFLGISLIENIQRESLNALELANSFSELSEKYNLSHEAIGALVGKSRTSVTNTLRLLNLSPYMQKLLAENEIEMGHARAVLSLSHSDQDLIGIKIVSQALSVRRVEMLVKSNSFRKEESTIKEQLFKKEISEWKECISSSLSKKVNVKINKEGKGKIEIFFNSRNEANDIAGLIRAMSEIED